MTEFTRTQPAGRMIARLIAKLGWAIMLAGLVLAFLAALPDAFPGMDGAPGAVTVLSRVLAALPGLGLTFFGLFSVMMAAQTRACIDSADIAREMLVLARRRPISLLAAVPPLGEAEPKRTPSIGAAVSRNDAADEQGARVQQPDPAATTRFVAGPKASEPTADGRREPRSEPVFAAGSRLKPAPGKVHPIFSARPPR